MALRKFWVLKQSYINMAENKYSKILFLVFPLLFIFLVYIQIINGFFQQDEWYSYGWYVIHRNLGFFEMIKFFISPDVGHYNPLTVAIQQILFSVWNLNYVNFAIVGVVSHIIVVVLLYFLSKEIFENNKIIPIVIAFLFGILASTYQAVTWVVADISTLWATIFGLISAILFIKYLSNKNIKYLTFSLCVLFISLLLKEITIGLFPLYFVIILFFAKKEVKLKSIIYIVLASLLYMLIRISMFFLPHSNSQSVVSQGQGFGKIIYNFLTVPIKSLSQTLVSQKLIQIISNFIANLFPNRISGEPGTIQFDEFVLKRITESFSLISGFFILLISTVVLIKNKINKETFPLFFGILWSILNSFIFAFSPGKIGIMFYIDSRNLYFVGIGIVIVVMYILNILSRKNNIRLLLLLLPIFLINIFYLNKNLKSFNETAILRHGILNKIVNDNPVLAKKTIFYIESDRAYYGLPETIKILPFQSGFGQTLLSWYEQKQNFPIDFFKNDFLWPIDSEGYKEFNGIGFGYFRDFISLSKFFSQNKIEDKKLISYSFNSINNELKDNSEEIKGRIEGYFSKKKMIDLRNAKIIFSDNSKDSFKTIDENRNTFWKSGLTYDHYLFATIDLKKNYEIAEMSIDSYNDPNQNNVGYRILISNNNKDWKTVFESLKYPPTSGIDELYFKPTIGRFIKLEQIGSHKYSPWVVNELKIYAKN